MIEKKQWLEYKNYKYKEITQMKKLLIAGLTLLSFNSFATEFIVVKQTAATHNKNTTLYIPFKEGLHYTGINKVCKVRTYNSKSLKQVVVECVNPGARSQMVVKCNINNSEKNSATLFFYFINARTDESTFSNMDIWCK